jgi:hypothetical protein
MRRNAPALLVVSAVLSACGGSDSAGPPTALQSLTTGTLSGTVGEPLPDPIRLRAVDAQGKAVSGVPVTFSVTQGGGLIDRGGAPASSVADTTDGNGEAAVTWTLGTNAAQTQVVTVSASGLSALAFNASAEPGPPASSAVGGDAALFGFTSDSADGDLTVVVKDAYENAIQGVQVSWTVANGGGTIASPTTSTDAQGVARVKAVLGPNPGFNFFLGSVSGLPPDTIDVLAITGVSDATGDAIDPGGGFVGQDVTKYGLAIVGTYGLVHVQFAKPVSPVSTSGTQPQNAVVSWIQLDLDQDSTTGFPAWRVCANPPVAAPLGFGSEAWIDLDPLSSFLGLFQQAGVTPPPDGWFAGVRIDSLVYTADACADTAFGYPVPIQPIYGTRTITGVYRWADVDDDGNFDFTSLFLSPGAGYILTDIVPDSLTQSFSLTTIASAGAADQPAAARVEDRMRARLGDRAIMTARASTTPVASPRLMRIPVARLRE